jgi:hypothetical protein
MKNGAKKLVGNIVVTLAGGLRPAYVFDVSQTDGEEIPELSTKVSGDVGERRERLVDFIIAQRIQLEFKESIAPALGASYGGKISLPPSLFGETLSQSSCNRRCIAPMGFRLPF